MKRNLFLIPATLIAIISAGCSSHPPATEARILTSSERAMCDSMQLDTTIIEYIRNYNKNRIEPFHYSLSRMIKDGKETELDPVYSNGIRFEEENVQAPVLVQSLQTRMKEKGYTIFLLENHFNIGHRPDVIAVLKTTDKYAILKQVRTDGINYGIDNDSVISLIKGFDSKYSLDLIGAGGDWCEFTISKDPFDWLDLAREVYKVCPDVVDQGTGNVDVLAKEIASDRHLFFWWD